jgi:hypothetical protein
MIRSTVEVIPVVDGDRFVGLMAWPSILAAAVGIPLPAERSR